jgi:hypothetical protein
MGQPTRSPYFTQPIILLGRTRFSDFMYEHFLSGYKRFVYGRRHALPGIALLRLASDDPRRFQNLVAEQCRFHEINI